MGYGTQWERSMSGSWVYPSPRAHRLSDIAQEAQSLSLPSQPRRGVQSTAFLRMSEKR